MHVQAHPLGRGLGIAGGVVALLALVPPWRGERAPAAGAHQGGAVRRGPGRAGRPGGRERSGGATLRPGRDPRWCAPRSRRAEMPGDDRATVRDCALTATRRQASVGGARPESRGVAEHHALGLRRRVPQPRRSPRLSLDLSLLVIGGPWRVGSSDDWPNPPSGFRTAGLDHIRFRGGAGSVFDPYSDHGWRRGGGHVVHLRVPWDAEVGEEGR